jgi:hypothetical protein
MNTDNLNSDDAPLDKLLHEWKPKAQLPPRFQEQVWRRIECAETAPAPTLTLAQLFTAWLISRLPRPALATAYVAVLLAIGAGVGWNQARQETVRVTTELGVRYAQSVDPYQAAP